MYESCVTFKIYDHLKVKNDFLDLQVPIWVTDFQFLPDDSTKILVATGISKVRLNLNLH